MPVGPTLLLACALGGSAPSVPPPEASTRIIGGALVESRAYERLSWLTDRIGHRLSGSPALERAVAWAVGELQRDGLDRVWTEPVAVPHWVRGFASASIVHPAEHELALLALGGSVGTPPGGVAADVVEFSSIEALRAAGEAVRGKIVLFNREMAPGFDSERGYGSVVKLRTEGASEAAKLGAVAALVRSLGTADFRLPHTGALRYADNVPKIPAAALSAEDALLIARLLASGERVRVRLDLGCKELPEAESANVLAELRGRERPEEIVLIGAHLDSWDVGQGAIDDGAGCVIVMEALRLLRRHGLVPRRTIRGVLFTNEENGLRGGRDYAKRHGTELHVAAIESDSGAAAPLGFGATAGAGAIEILRELARPLSGIGAAMVVDGGGGADIGPLGRYGVPRLSLRQDSQHYFDYHHTEADTLDKVDRLDLDRNVAALAWLAYALAERLEPLPRPEPTTQD